MRKNGFTLIELLAVIVILAIIALIAVPIIIDIIEDSKKEALKRSAENYLKAVELAIAKENLNGEFNPPSCTIESGITRCDGKTLNVSVDGELPDSGTITLSNGTIEKTSLTTLTYKSGTLTYKEGKMVLEAPKKELIAEGVIIPETTSGVAINVDNQLVYYVPEGSNEAMVLSYKGDIDYSNSYDRAVGDPQATGDIKIASRVKINNNIYTVTSIADTAFVHSTCCCADITSVEIPNTITSIGDEAFWYCTNLSNITIPSSVVNIGGWAFMETNLSNITIPSSVKSIGKYAFDGCTSLNTITIEEGVTSIGDEVFWGCTNLSNITIPSSVISIGEDAFGFSSITTININKPSGSIEGSPWGSSATVNWLG